jgi:hypothetical protein
VSLTLVVPLCLSVQNLPVDTRFTDPAFWTPAT